MKSASLRKNVQRFRSMRLQRATDLLAQKSGTVAEICYATCFSDQANLWGIFYGLKGLATSTAHKWPGLREFHPRV